MSIKRIPSFRDRIEFNNDNTHIKYEYCGKPVPSITTILKVISMGDGLMMWANHLGWKRKSYKDELEKAAYGGTLAHKYAEYVLMNELSQDDSLDRSLENLKDEIYNADDDVQSIAAMAISSFKKWWLNNKHRVEVISVEESMTMPNVGGTVDLVCRIDGVLTIIDIKTSSAVSFKHFLQTAKCAHLYEFNHGEMPKNLAILRLDKKGGNEAEIHNVDDYFNIRDIDNIIPVLISTFESIRKVYYNIYNTKSIYKGDY